jgi:hypothetical protein
VALLCQGLSGLQLEEVLEVGRAAGLDAGSAARPPPQGGRRPGTRARRHPPHVCAPAQVSGPELQRQLLAVLGRGLLGSGRSNGLGAMLEAARKRARAAADPASLASFPSLRITAAELTPQVKGRR